MKKAIFGLIAIFLFSNLVSAQEDPEKALNKAAKALGSYNLDPSNNGDKLKEAVQMIDIAAKADVNKDKVKTWQTRGEIYNSLSDKDMANMFKNPESVPEHPNAPLIAAESFLKALEVSTKKYEIKDAVTGMTESAGKLNNIANSQLKSASYNDAYKSLEMVMKVNDAVKKNGGTPVLVETDIPNHKYVMAYSAAAAGNKEVAAQLYKELYEANSDEATVYAQHFDYLYQQGKKEEAWVVFNKGQAKFPASNEIMFAGINAKIAEGATEDLKTMLAKAIELEPNNPSIYTALGNVYMNLFTAEYAKDNASQVAKGYFDESLKYFNKAVELDAKQFDAIYSIGSLYFNKAVELIKKANALPMDKESQKKYKIFMDEANNLMSTALPYFQKTESMQPADINTLIALSEIFARTNDLEKSQMFKSRLEKAKAGQDVGPAYFKN